MGNIINRLSKTKDVYNLSNPVDTAFFDVI